MLYVNLYKERITKIIYIPIQVSNLIVGYTSLVNEVNILKKVKNINGMCKENDDVLLLEMIKVNINLYFES